MSLHVPVLSDERVSTLLEDIDRQGFGIIEDFVGPAELERMRRFVAGAVRDADGGYAGLTGPDAVNGSGLDELARSSPFRDMIERIYQRGTGRSPPNQEFYQLLRCLTGQSAHIHSYLFHHDSYILTFLIPIEIPVVGETGDLLMLPNRRRVRKTYAFNVLDKLILDNRVTQWALRLLTTQGLMKITRIKMIPGNAYLFSGYRSIHTNEPCSVGQVRATALFHYDNPHAGRSALRAVFQR